MIFGPQIYALAAFTILYPLILIGAVLYIRHRGRKEGAAENAERRQRPKLRLVLNILAAVPTIFIAGYVGMQVWSFMGMTGGQFTSTSYLLCGVMILCLVAMRCVIFAVRRFEKEKSLEKYNGVNRRHRKWLRRAINALIIIPVVVLVAVILIRAAAELN